MAPEIYLIADDMPGSLFIMPCPSADDLRRDIEAYRDRGVEIVVSMLALDEAKMLGLSEERNLCERAGLEFISAPIVDFGLPDPTDYDALVNRIAGDLRCGKKIAVHCRAGIGRSGMVTAGTLIALGMEAETAVNKVAHVRGVSIPDTVEQGRFVAEYHARICGK